MEFYGAREIRGGRKSFPGAPFVLISALVESTSAFRAGRRQAEAPAFTIVEILPRESFPSLSFSLFGSWSASSSARYDRLASGGDAYRPKTNSSGTSINSDARRRAGRIISEVIFTNEVKHIITQWRARQVYPAVIRLGASVLRAGVSSGGFINVRRFARNRFPRRNAIMTGRVCKRSANYAKRYRGAIERNARSRVLDRRQFN